VKPDAWHSGGVYAVWTCTHHDDTAVPAAAMHFADLLFSVGGLHSNKDLTTVHIDRR